MDKLYAGLDIGTSGCKIALYDEDGNFVRDWYAAYDVVRRTSRDRRGDCVGFG